MPHVTLVPFFRTPDRLVADMVDLLYRVVESERRRLPHPLRLESYVSPNFMGFFVEEEGAQVLKTMAGRFVDGLASMGQFTSEIFSVQKSITFWVRFYHLYVFSFISSINQLISSCLPKHSKLIGPNFTTLYMITRA